jgi:RNA polymerase sigma-70 factor (sigma-E family)
MTEHPLAAQVAAAPVARGRESDDFDAFVRTRTPSLLRSAYLLTGDQHLAQDLVQSALIRTHRAWRRLDRTEHAEAYTRRAMYHIQVSMWRRTRFGESLVDTLPEPRGAARDEASVVLTRLLLREALAKLTNRQRVVLVLRFFEDLSEAETAQLLGVSIGTIKSQTSKALARLRAVSPELTERYFREAT